MSACGKIWLIGGTSESTEIAIALAQKYPCLVTVTTPAAIALYPQIPLLKVWVGQIDLSQVGSFFSQHKICAVIDASHPYAVEISKGAIAATREYNLPYLRYERPSVPSVVSETMIELESFETLLQGNYLLNQRVLLTVGYKALPLFSPWQERCTLFARLLPSSTSLEVAFAAGFTSHRIIALRPPVSAELEKALWQQWQISRVVTKASGKAGGEDVKRLVSQELGIPLIIIGRPSMTYPQQTSKIATVLEFCEQVFNDYGGSHYSRN